MPGKSEIILFHRKHWFAKIIRDTLIFLENYYSHYSTISESGGKIPWRTVKNIFRYFKWLLFGEKSVNGKKCFKATSVVKVEVKMLLVYLYITFAVFKLFSKEQQKFLSPMFREVSSFQV